MSRVATSPPAERSTLIAPAGSLDAPGFRDALGSEPVLFRHPFAGSPLLALDALAEAVRGAPSAWTKVTDGTVEPSGDTRSLPESAVDAMRALTTRRVTVRLYHLELLTAYRELVDSVVGEIGKVDVSAGAFCAGPHAVVPVHVDRYDNLLLQVAGTKRIEIGRFPDPARQQAAIDRDLAGARGDPKVLPPPILAVELRPGDGVYLPAYSFHWTQNGEEPSVAVSVAWSTPATIELDRVQKYNQRMRRLGLRPAPVGAHPTVDRAKSVVVRLIDQARDR